MRQSPVLDGVAARDTPSGRLKQKAKLPIKNQSPEVKTSGVSGAATQIRTGDLILTKDVLYQLSHSSKSKDISS